MNRPYRDSFYYIDWYRYLLGITQNMFLPFLNFWFLKSLSLLFFVLVKYLLHNASASEIKKHSPTRRFPVCLQDTHLPGMEVPGGDDLVSFLVLRVGDTCFLFLCVFLTARGGFLSVS